MAECQSYLIVREQFRTAITPEESAIDDFAFRLHYRYTFRLLSIVVFISFIYKLLDPITCYSLNLKDAIPEKTLNSYCLMQNTFTLPDAVAKGIGTDVVFQGIEKETPESAKEYQRYYQWVPVFLLAQASSFVLLHVLWTSMEHGEILGLIQDLSKPILPQLTTPNVKRSDIAAAAVADCLAELQVARVVKHLVFTVGEGKYCRMARWYWLISLLNLANVCLQICFTDYFLGGEFYNNGWKLLTFWSVDYSERTDAMVSVFPRMTKCTFHQFGVGGDVQHYDIMCVLPFNFFYENVFLFNIAWFTFVAVVSFMYLVYWTLVLVFSKFQAWVWSCSNMRRVLRPEQDYSWIPGPESEKPSEESSSCPSSALLQVLNDNAAKFLLDKNRGQKVCLLEFLHSSDQGLRFVLDMLKTYMSMANFDRLVLYLAASKSMEENGPHGNDEPEEKKLLSGYRPALNSKIDMEK